MIGKRMEGRTALITGGGTGIGAAIARLFALEGAKIFICGRRQEPLQEVVASVKADGGEADCHIGDVRVLDDVKRIAEAANAKFGIIDTLVNNAGVVSRLEDPTKMSDEDWNWQMDTNVRGVFHTTKLILPDMISKGGGTIVNIASTSAYRASSGYATYSASKAAVIAYTRVIAIQLASKGIRANTVSPGIVHTPMAYVDRQDFTKMETSLANLHPLGRIGRPEDVANAVLFLSCEESSWITGQDLVIDGGLSASG